MTELEPLPDDADADIARGNRRIAAALLVAIALAAIVMMAAGQALAAAHGCGEPGSGHTGPSLIAAGELRPAS